ARQCLTRRPTSIEIIEATRAADGAFQPIPLHAEGSPRSFDILLIEHGYPGVDAFAILKDLTRRQPQVPVIVVVEWDDRLAIPALKLGASDCVVKATDAFRTLFFRLDRGLRDSSYQGWNDTRDQAPAATAPHAGDREQLEQQVRDALARGRELEQRLNAAAEHVRDSEARFHAAIDRERAQRESLELKLAAAEEARGDVERQLDADTKLSAALVAERQAEYDAQLADGAVARAVLERRVADAEVALRHAAERHASEETAAAERPAQPEAGVPPSPPARSRARATSPH